MRKKGSIVPSKRFSKAVLAGLKGEGYSEEAVREMAGISGKWFESAVAGRLALTDAMLDAIEEETGLSAGELAAKALEPGGGAFTELSKLIASGLSNVVGKKQPLKHRWRVRSPGLGNNFWPHFLLKKGGWQLFPFGDLVMNEQRAIPVIVGPGAGRVIRAFGDELAMHLTGKETQGRYTMFTDTTPVGGGPPVHRHDREDEWFLVLEGKASYFVEGRWTEPSGPGTAVFASRGSAHAFKNAGDVPLKQLITLSPAGFEDFFAEAEREFARAEGPRMEKLLEIGAEHGIELMMSRG
jgi:quercetin dioxygenase-like cupin family protein